MKEETKKRLLKLGIIDEKGKDGGGQIAHGVKKQCNKNVPSVVVMKPLPLS